MYVTTLSWMSSIMGLFGVEESELYCLELEKIAIFDFICILASANINKSVPD